ncbi:MAG: hypothetical protein NUW09_03075, partial [Deltaproteobacteria bacterium]|nr:hypothetical protein [Deltaproteobacteria bacterium]
KRLPSCKGACMSPAEEGIIRRKLAVIIACLKALEPIKGMTVDEYLGDLYKRKTAERLMQLAFHEVK